MLSLSIGVGTSTFVTALDVDVVFQVNSRRIFLFCASLFCEVTMLLFCFFQAFSSLLKRDVSLNFKSKGNPLVSVLTCNILMEAFSEEKHWPDTFVKVMFDVSWLLLLQSLEENKTPNSSPTESFPQTCVG